MSIHFVLTKADLLPVLDLVVSLSWPVRYTVMDDRLRPDFESYLSSRDIPGLGEADHDNGSGCRQFLMTRSEVRPKVESFGTNPRRFSVDQLVNNNSVVLCAAGKREDRLLLVGTVGSAWRESDAMTLMKSFRKAFAKLKYERVGVIIIGPEAAKMNRAGCRMTIAKQSSPEFDLTLPPVA